MIETCALFFMLMSLAYYIKLIHGKTNLLNVTLYIVFGSLGILQKSTTEGPVILFMITLLAYTIITKAKIKYTQYIIILFSLLIIISAGAGWAWYTDCVKVNNPFGTQLTSRAVSSFTFGTLKQRFDFSTWKTIIYDRMILGNCGGVIGVALISFPFLIRNKRPYMELYISCLTLFILPLLIFTNLHYVHHYYQVSCLVFMIAALSIAITTFVDKTDIPESSTIILLLLIISINIFAWSSFYGIWIKRGPSEIDPKNALYYKVGQHLRKVTPLNTGLVVFGSDYSSEVGYQSERKSMTVPPWFKNYKDLWINPQKYLGPLKLGAIVVFPGIEFPKHEDVVNLLKKHPNWGYESIDSTDLVFPR